MSKGDQKAKNAGVRKPRGPEGTRFSDHKLHLNQWPDSLGTIYVGECTFGGDF